MGKKKQKKNKVNGKLSSWVSLASIPASEMTSEVRRLSQVTTLAPASTSSRYLSSGVTSAQEWTSYLARWTEARVLSVRITLAVPLDGSAPTASGIPGRCFIGTDRSAALASGLSAAATAALAAVRNFPASDGRLIQYEARATDFEDQNFDAVGSMTARFAIHVLYTAVSGTGAAVWSSIPVMLEYGVQFRGPQ